MQDALDGKESAPVVHKKVNSDFPLKGFVLCAGCGKKLTAGFVKGRNDKYPRYWCFNKACPFGSVPTGMSLSETSFVY